MKNSITKLNIFAFRSGASLSAGLFATRSLLPKAMDGGTLLERGRSCPDTTGTVRLIETIMETTTTTMMTTTITTTKLATLICDKYR
jgi:hypothetical protein